MWGEKATDEGKERGTQKERRLIGHWSMGNENELVAFSTTTTLLTQSLSTTSLSGPQIKMNRHERERIFVRKCVGGLIMRAEERVGVRVASMH